MKQLHELIGSECDFDQVGAALRRMARSLGVAVVGAYQVTCSDESELECAEALQRTFIAQALPGLKPNRAAPFRTTNLGARYERGAIAIAEQHFALPGSAEAAKLLVVKLNSHVGRMRGPEGFEYGPIRRYGMPSVCCGALAAMLDGADLPAAKTLAAMFTADGVDRLAVLRDPEVVPRAERALRAAIVNARLQTLAVLDDIAGRKPTTPTAVLVLPSVTINNPGPDAELIVGEAGIDWQDETPAVHYRRPGADPAAYRVRHTADRVLVEDDDWPMA